MTEEDHEIESDELRSSDAFIEALASGDAREAAKSLRKLKCLEVPHLAILADMLDDTSIDGPISPMLFPWRLVFKARAAGRPYNYLRNQAEEFSVALGLNAERARHGLMKQAGPSQLTHLLRRGS